MYGSSAEQRRREHSVPNTVVKSWLRIFSRRVTKKVLISLGGRRFWGMIKRAVISEAGSPRSYIAPLHIFSVSADNERLIKGSCRLLVFSSPCCQLLFREDTLVYLWLLHSGPEAFLAPRLSSVETSHWNLWSCRYSADNALKAVVVE